MNELALFAGANMNWKSSEYARNKAKAWRLANPERVAEYRAKKTLGFLDENIETLLNLARYLECHG